MTRMGQPGALVRDPAHLRIHEQAACAIERDQRASRVIEHVEALRVERKDASEGEDDPLGKASEGVRVHGEHGGRVADS